MLRSALGNLGAVHRALDITLVLMCLAFAEWLRLNLDAGATGVDEAFGTPGLLPLFAVAIWLMAFQIAGVYSVRDRVNPWQAGQRFAFGFGLAALLFFGMLYITYRDYSRLQSVYFLSSGIVSLGGYRLGLYAFRRATGRALTRRRPVLVIGTDANAARVGEVLARYGRIGLDLIGYVKVTTNMPKNSPALELNRPILGDLSTLTELIERHAIRELVIASDWNDHEGIRAILPQVGRYTLNVRIAPDYTDLAYFQVRSEDFGGLPLIALREDVLSASQRFWKRAFDVAASLIILTAGFPVFALVALAIWLEDRGPILIRQQRVGEGGRLFTMYKFRSMRVHPTTEQQKQPDDPRVTRIGRFIRRTSLDELPQFVNILRGDMSLVGPRPEMPWLVNQYEPWQRKRFEVPQGLTGWWQVNGRADRPMFQHTEDDLFYIRHYSLMLDMKIVFRTVLVVIFGRGAY